jgi:F-type H+-transporting ATPase subunit epsilon
VADERSLRLEVVTPEGEVYHDQVAMVVLPGIEGELGVLPRHVPLVTLLAIGETRILGRDGTWSYVATGIGYAAIRGSRVLLVVDHGELAGAIDVGRAEEAVRRAKERMEERRDLSAEAEVDYYRAEEALKRAENRLRVAARVR